MNQIIRIILQPLLGVVTLAIGVLFVLAIQLLPSSSSAPAVPPGAPEARAPERLENLEPVNPTKTELLCYDTNVLPIWKELKQDPHFRQVIKAVPGRYDCADIVEIERVDLGGDRESEFLVSGKSISFFCGATGNCHMWVFGKRNGRMTRLLHSGGITFEPSNLRSKLYRTLVVRFNGSSYPDSLSEYHFDGRRYRLAKCYQQDKQTLEKSEESCDDWEEDGDV